MGKITYLRVSSVKGLVKELGRRSGKEFLEALDEAVKDIITRASKQESKKKTLEASVVKEVLNGEILPVKE